MSRRVLGAVLWTVAMVSGLSLVDRLALGPRYPVGWFQVAGPAELPPSVPPVSVPFYLPEEFAWPPSQVWVRVHDGAGWWTWSPSSVHPQQGLWLGVGAGPPPAAMGVVAGCMGFEGHQGCPGGWRWLSVAREDGETINLIARLDPEELARVARGLSSR